MHIFGCVLSLCMSVCVCVSLNSQGHLEPGASSHTGRFDYLNGGDVALCVT